MPKLVSNVVAIPPAPRPSDTVVPAQPLNPCELEIDLFCKGMRIEPFCALAQDARSITHTRAGRMDTSATRRPRSPDHPHARGQNGPRGVDYRDHRPITRAGAGRMRPS